MEKKIVKNTAIYTVKTVIGSLFPIITFPYIARVLDVDTIGKVNFAQSIVTYFILFAGLGIYTYAVKEGAVIKDNKLQWNEFASEVFTFNIITTVISMVLFFVLYLINAKWQDYGMEMLILSIAIPLQAVGVDWIFTVYEEYFYITKRAILVQLLSLVYLFLFVKNNSDIYHYALYTTFTNSGSQICNLFAARKFVKLRLKFSKRMKSFLKPALFLFASSVATQIYLSSDMTMLGYMATDYEVGYYSVSVKIYNIAKTVMLSLGVVAVPRLANLIRNDRNAYTKLFRELFNINILAIIPAAVGLAFVSEEVITIFAGEQYQNCGLILSLLALSLPFAIMGSFLASGNLALIAKEKEIYKATALAALVNISLNMLLLHRYGAIAAAFTTLIAEMTTFGIHFYYAGKSEKITGIKINLLQSVCSSTIMLLICIPIKAMIKTLFLRFVITVLCGVLAYCSCLLMFRNGILVTAIKKMWEIIEIEKH